MQARLRVVEIMQGNRAAPLKLAALFEKHMGVLAEDAEARAEALMAQQPPLTLEDFDAVLQGYREQAESVRLMCANSVRTGAYACAPRLA